MKNKSLKFLLSLTVISCLLFTACGTDETIAPTAEATAENETESTVESVAESEPESTVETEPIAESETQQGTIEGYEAPEEVEEETIDKSELNDIGNESYNGEDEPVVEEPVVETPADDEGTPYTLTEGDKEALRMLGATEDEINSIKTEQQFIALLDILTQRGGFPGGSSGSGSGNSGGGNSNGGGNSGGSSVDETHDPSRVPDLDMSIAPGGSM